MKNLLDEVKRLQKIAGILKERINEAPINDENAKIINRIEKKAKSFGFEKDENAPPEESVWIKDGGDKKLRMYVRNTHRKPNGEIFVAFYNKDLDYPEGTTDPSDWLAKNDWQWKSAGFIDRAKKTDKEFDTDEFADKFQKALSPNPEPPVWKSILASDKKTLGLIDKKIKELYKGAEKLPESGYPIWATDQEAETTIPIAIYSWQDPDRPKEVEGDPRAIIPEDPEEAQEFYDEYDGPGDLIPFITHISVQKQVDSGDIAYWEILVNGETNDPYGEPTGYLTGKYAKDSIFNTATKAGLPKGTPGGFNADNKYGDRTNE